MIVDVHIHVAPPEFLDALGKHAQVVPAHDGDGVKVTLGEAVVPLSASFLSPEGLLARLDQVGIDVAVISLVPLVLGYKLPPAAAREVAEAANRGIARYAASAPRRFRWLAHVPLQDVSASTAIMEQAMAAGAQGVLIGTNVAGRNLDEPELKPFFEAAARLGAFVLVHANDCMAPERLKRHYAINIVGNPIEAGVAVASIVLGGLLDRHQGLKLCVCHGGGTGPAMAGRWDHAWSIGRMGGTKLPKAPSAYFRALWFDSLTYGPEQLRLLVTLAGAERIMLGSDQPFPIAHPDPAGFVRKLDWLGPAEKEAITGGNARALFKLEE